MPFLCLFIRQRKHGTQFNKRMSLSHALQHVRERATHISASLIVLVLRNTTGTIRCAAENEYILFERKERVLNATARDVMIEEERIACIK